MKPTEPADRKLIEYLDAEARKYYQSLPLEDTIDTVPQGNSRRITLTSFGLVHILRPDVQCFNELLIVYPRPGGEGGRVVPNNFVVIHPEPIKVYDTFDISQQPTRPFLAIEYITEYRRKELEQNVEKYERDLRIPYYLRVYPHDAKFALCQLVNGKYASVRPNAAGRAAIPALELEVGLHEGWVRYWFRGEFLMTSDEMLREIHALRAQREAETARIIADLEAADAAAAAAIARLREELAKAKGQGG